MGGANQNQEYKSPPVNAMGRAFDPDATSDERTYALLMHLTLLLNLTGVGGPISFAIVLVMWLVKREESPYLDDHGREAVNFQISLFLWSLILIVGAVFTCGLSAILLIAVPVVGSIGMIFAAVAANRGEFYRYPMTIRFLH